MNTIPLSTAKAIASSFNDAKLNNEISKQSFVDEYRANVYYDTIARITTLFYDKTNHHDISRIVIEEKSVKGTFQRVYLDNVSFIGIDDTETFLVIDAEPYKLCIQIDDSSKNQ